MLAHLKSAQSRVTEIKIMLSSLGEGEVVVSELLKKTGHESWGGGANSCLLTPTKYQKTKKTNDEEELCNLRNILWITWLDNPLDIKKSQIMGKRRLSWYDSGVQASHWPAAVRRELNQKETLLKYHSIVHLIFFSYGKNLEWEWKKKTANSVCNRHVAMVARLSLWDSFKSSCSFSALKLARVVCELNWNALCCLSLEVLNAHPTGRSLRGGKALNSLWRMLLPSGLGLPLAATALAGKCCSLLESTTNISFI